MRVMQGSDKCPAECGLKSVCSDDTFFDGHCIFPEKRIKACMVEQWTIKTADNGMFLGIRYNQDDAEKMAERLRLKYPAGIVIEKKLKVDDKYTV